MNERIEKLFGQALDQAVPETWTMLTPAQLSKLKEKFAELIVRECSKTVNDTEYPYEDPAHKETWDACCVWSAEKLKEHFGVEA